MPPKKKRVAAVKRKKIDIPDSQASVVDAILSEELVIESVKHRQARKNALNKKAEIAKVEEKIVDSGAKAPELANVETNKENHAENSPPKNVQLTEESDVVGDAKPVAAVKRGGRRGANKVDESVATSAKETSEKPEIEEEKEPAPAKRGGRREVKKIEEDVEELVEETPASDVDHMETEDAKPEKKAVPKRGVKRGAKKVEEEESAKAEADLPIETDAAEECAKPEKTAAKRGGKRVAIKVDEPAPAEQDVEEHVEDVDEVTKKMAKPEKNTATKRGGKRGAKKVDEEESGKMEEAEKPLETNAGETSAKPEKATAKRGGKRGATKVKEPAAAEEEVAIAIEDAETDSPDESEAPAKPEKTAAKRGGKRGAKKVEELATKEDEMDKIVEVEEELDDVEQPAKVEKKTAAKRGGRRVLKKAEEQAPDEEMPAPEEPNEPKSVNGAAGPKKRGGKKREAEKPQTGESGQDRNAPEPDEKKSKANETEEETYDCDKENKKGEKWNLKISTWNVAGMRAWVKKNGQDYITKEDPDIICFQETKCPESKVPAEAKIEGYHFFWANSAKDGYAGVALYSKEKPIKVTTGIGNAEHDEEGRAITAEYEKFFLVATYVPNAGQGLKTLPKRMLWDGLFLEYLKNLDAKKPVILCGDLNVAHQEIDLANPKTNKKSAGFTQEERDGMTKMLGEGFADSFRHLYPERTGAYTFWTYMGNARARNTGWRLDYFIVSERLLDSVCDVTIRNKVLGSDHCPVTLFIHV